jgi:REP element-mobilizing transposase RayT
VTKDRLPIFRTDDIKTIACKAIDEARVSGRVALFAYVLMWDHIHWITDAMRKPSDILRYVDGIISHPAFPEKAECVHHHGRRSSAKRDRSLKISSSTAKKPLDSSPGSLMAPSFVRGGRTQWHENQLMQ